MEGFFAHGLERYHLRKPGWSASRLEQWLRALPADWLPRLVLHQHHALVEALGLGGRHDRDAAGLAATAGFSRSCHGLPGLRRHLPGYGQILFGPVFDSFSKPGYGPSAQFPWAELTRLLASRGPGDCTRVLAIGGVDAGRLGHCRKLGFDGAAVLGAVWTSDDPVAAFAGIQDAARTLGGARHAA
jgi:thiamine-phosphate pyrophosphorylase